MREPTDLQFGPNVYKTGLLYQTTLAIIDRGAKNFRQAANIGGNDQTTTC
jgi:hypothetical protein